MPSPSRRIATVCVVFITLLFALHTFFITHARFANQPPVAVADSHNVHRPTAAWTNPSVLANDYDPENNSMSVNPTGVYWTANGSMNINSSGGVAYTPNKGFTGTDTHTYRVCDSQSACSTGTITFNVSNQPPTAIADFYTVKEAIYVSDNIPWLLANDSDPDNDPISVKVINQCNWTSVGGTICVYSYGAFSYRPPSGFTGTDFWTYTVCDDLGLCSNATVFFYVVSNDGAEDAGGVPCNQFVGEPVNVTNGNVYLFQTDFQSPGVGEGLNITRAYNSISDRINLFGRGWSTAFDESVRVYDTYLVRLYLPDGRGVNFSRTSTSGAFLPREGDFHGVLSPIADGYSLQLKDGAVHRFNTSGRLTTLADRNGNQTVLAYDAGGKLTSITYPSGRVLTTATNANGRVLSLSDSLGTVATYAYGASNELLSVTYPDGSQFVFTYGYILQSKPALTSVKDALGNVLESHAYTAYNSRPYATTSERHGGVERYSLSYVNLKTQTNVTDALGRVTKYYFDGSKGRNVVTKVEGTCGCGTSQTRSWTYDARMNILSVKDALNRTTSYTYDYAGNRLTETNVLGTTTYTYNGYGQVLTETDPMGGVTTYTYDTQGNLLSVKDALNKTTAFAYDPRGLPLSATDARSNKTEFAYDAAGNLIERKDAALHTNTFAYDVRGRLTSTTDALNQTTAYEYDAAGRIKKVTRPDNAFVTFTYDLAGRRTRVTDARNNSANYEYDAAYRLTKVTDAAGKFVTSGYDLVSNPTSRTDQLGRTTGYEYDEFNRLKKITYPPAAVGAARLEERIEYDAAGNVTKKVDTAGRETVYAYDPANRLIKVTDPALKVTQFEHNARSQRTAVVDALAQRYEFAYDPLGRLLSQTRAGLTMSYEYDAVGNRTKRVDYKGQETDYAYDALNRLTTITYPDATTVGYAYDALSRLTSATNQHGTVTTAYDNRNRVSSTTDVWGRTITYGYDANSNRTSMQLGAMLGATYGYDATNRLTQITDDANATVSFGYDAARRLISRSLPNGVSTSYTYDGLGRLTRLTHATSATVLADYQYQFDTANQITQIAEPGGTRTFGYDVTNRLTGVTNTNGANESYGYDAVGNRASSHLSAGYSYLAFNRLIGTSTASYGHDNNGNLISKTDSSGSWTYEWDYENRLKRATRPDGQSVSYNYDALGRRVERVEGSNSTKFTYDGLDVVLDQNSDGTTVGYLNGLGIDNKLRQTINGQAQYFLTDHLGSTKGLADANGISVAQASYDSFGNSSGNLNTRYQFTGREYDSFTGLYYHRARWYDPNSGRFISEDPIGFAGGDVNLFGYVWNSPLKYSDPTGLDGWGNDTADWLDERIEYARQYWQYGDQEWVANGINNSVAQVAFGISDYFRVGSGTGHALYDCDDNGYGRAANVLKDVGRAAGIFSTLAGPFAGRVGTPNKTPIPAKGYHNETVAPRPVKPQDAVDEWENFLGPGPYSNKHPRTGQPDPDRLVSADGKRSIRYGDHEMNSKPTKHHYHEETWTHDTVNNVMNVDNRVIRVPNPRR